MWREHNFGALFNELLPIVCTSSLPCVNEERVCTFAFGCTSVLIRIFCSVCIGISQARVFACPWLCIVPAKEALICCVSRLRIFQRNLQAFFEAV
jgi:hypothetical protein